MAYGTKTKGKKGKTKAKKGAGQRFQGKLMAKPGAKPAMSRAGAMKGKNPNAQVSKPKKSHTPGEGTK